jgi:hypothetical protein
LAPLPARVVTAVVRVLTTRMRWLKVSATKSKTREEERGGGRGRALAHTPSGRYSMARGPAPSAHPALALPARVVTSPLPRATLRILWFIESATHTCPPPSGSAAMPEGALKAANPPRPSLKPATPLPARVVTSPPGPTTRTLWLFLSITYPMLVAGCTATSQGEESSAAVPLPSAKLGTPLAPTSVEREHPEAGALGVLGTLGALGVLGALGAVGLGEAPEEGEGEGEGVEEPPPPPPPPPRQRGPGGAGC